MELILNLKYAIWKAGIYLCNTRKGERARKYAQLNTDYTLCKLFKEVSQACPNEEQTNKLRENFMASIQKEKLLSIGIISVKSTPLEVAQTTTSLFLEGNQGRYLGVGKVSLETRDRILSGGLLANVKKTPEK